MTITDNKNQQEVVFSIPEYFQWVSKEWNGKIRNYPFCIVDKVFFIAQNKNTLIHVKPDLYGGSYQTKYTQTAEE